MRWISQFLTIRVQRKFKQAGIKTKFNFNRRLKCDTGGKGDGRHYRRKELG